MVEALLPSLPTILRLASTSAMMESIDASSSGDSLLTFSNRFARVGSMKPETMDSKENDEVMRSRQRLFTWLMKLWDDT